MKNENFLGMLHFPGELFFLLKTSEELRDNFPHLETCSRQSPLSMESEKMYVSSRHPFVGGITGNKQFITCHEFGVRRQCRQ